MIDIVTVAHNDDYMKLADRLYWQIDAFEKDFTFSIHDNRTNNVGFGAGCNAAAFGPERNGEIIGFLNPDVTVDGPFIHLVRQTMSDLQVVITGNRFGKPAIELREWGVKDWVCGATFFVRRDWFTLSGGFDPRYVWAWEETDLIRQAESQGLKVKSINLPLAHASPSNDTNDDASYKVRHFEAGKKAFYEKWGSDAVKFC